MRAEKSMGTQSRADLVRQRRNQRSQQKMTELRKPSSHAAKSQSSIRQTAPTNRPVKANKVRRQIYYALGTSGAELRLPAVPFVHFGWRFISGSLVVLFSIALYTLLFSPRFQISGIQVKGIQRLTSGDINAVLDMSGKSVVFFDPQKAAKDLTTAFPELDDIQISVQLPSEILIQVTERQPTIIWNADGISYWIDSEGIILPPRGSVDNLLEISADNHPPLTPVAGQDSAANTETAGKTAEVVLIPQTGASVEPNSALWGRQVDTRTLALINDMQTCLSAEFNPVYSSIHGLGWQDPRGWKVFIGKELSNFELKLSIVSSVVAQLEAQGSLPKELISVEYIDAPYFK